MTPYYISSNQLCIFKESSTAVTKKCEKNANRLEAYTIVDRSPEKIDERQCTVITFHHAEHYLSVHVVEKKEMLAVGE